MHGLKQALADIWRLTAPYFMTRDVGEVRVWPFGTFRLQERWIGLTLAFVVIAIEFAQVAINVRLSYFNRDWFNSIQNKDEPAFWQLLIFVFSFWAAIYVVSAIYQYALRSTLEIRWRDWMTRRLSEAWLGDGVHYRMQLQRGDTDNPDQRIQEDIRKFTITTVLLTLGVISQVTTLASFSVILWSISAGFTIPGTDIAVPGLMFWVAFIYAVIGTTVTHWIGKPLIRLNFEQERYEANFRFSLARLREYGEQVALLGGAQAETGRLRDRFDKVIENWFAIVSRTKRLTAVTATYFQTNVVVPYIIAAPFYFTGKITLGVMTQTAGAFARVESALSFFISAYTTLADYKAVVDRLTTFNAAIAGAEALADTEPQVSVEPAAGDALSIKGLELRLPSGVAIVRVPSLTLREGETALLVGPSGSGKSTLFRAIAGIWPFGDGSIAVPKGRSVMLLPQRPYIPIGTLRGAVAYPSSPDTYDDAAVKEALAAVKLPNVIARMDEEAYWAQTLSLGEQQRVAIARALLAKPDWLFLDEATAALDEDLEKAIYALLVERLPETTVVSIGHRSTLRAFHERRIEMRPGEGGVFTPVDVKAPVAA